MDLEFVALHGTAEIHFELEVFHHLIVHRGLVDRELALPATLREVHRQVGVPKDLVRRVTHFQRSNTDADTDEDVATTQLERRAQGGGDAFRDRNHVRHAVHILEQHRELVAAESRDGVTGTHAGRQARRRCHE